MIWQPLFGCSFMGNDDPGTVDVLNNHVGAIPLGLMIACLLFQ